MKLRILNVLPIVILVMLTMREILTLIIGSSSLVSYYLFPVYNKLDSFWIVFDFFSFIFKGAMAISLILLIKLRRAPVTNRQAMLSGLLLGAFILKMLIGFVFVLENLGFIFLLSVVTFILIGLNFILVLLAKPSNPPHRIASVQNFQTNYPQQPVYPQPQYVQPPQPPVQQSMISELAELERMRDSGSLTPEEFTAAKKRVLGD
ncbi:MAG: hypothetical protein RJA33_135 [Actinomycetota bacterium]|jgi:hypothetical protein